MTKKYTPILCIDFDGVINSYKSGWQGMSNIPDSANPGAMDWLASLLSLPDSICAMAPRYLDFDVQIYSSRSQSWFGRRAMKKWIAKEFKRCGYPPELVELIKFPRKKPAAWLTIDDRAICFNGKFPKIEEMKNFKPWYKK